MENRSEELLALRPLLFLDGGNEKPLEKFQNQVLRPILKYQHELWVLELKQNQFLLQIKEKRWNGAELRQAIQSAISRSPDLKNRYFGIVTGLMTSEEYSFYLTNRTELNKRIISMVIDRILSI
jgi:fatty acid-binding protein DegV